MCIAGAAQPGSSKAGFPWWAGLIIALVVVAILGAATLAACLVIRRRRRGNAAVVTALDQKVGLLAPSAMSALVWMTAVHLSDVLFEFPGPDRSST